MGKATTPRCLTVLLAIGSLAIAITQKVQGQDEYMTCSRPVKSSRASRQHVQPPCDTMDHDKDSWCTLPGPMYPWHSVRRFVFENQGLMRRMYGEVRQLSLLRMEFSGESNMLEEARDFDDLFKPITTFDPSSTLSSYLTTESIPTLVVTSSSFDESIPKFNNLSTSSEEPIKDVDDLEAGRIGHSEETSDLMTTISDMITTTEETGSGTVEKDVSGGDGGIVDLVRATEEPPLATTMLNVSDEEQQSIPGSVASIEVIVVQTQDAPSSSTPLTIRTSSEEVEDWKTRNEGQVLFQDVEKRIQTTQAPTISTEESRIRTTNRQGVNACPVKEEVVAPYWANNTRGEVLALLNLYPFEQYIHWEKCTNEHRQMYCRDGCRCEQQYRLHRLLAFDPQNECRGIFSDWFRFPSCCVCKCYFDDLIPERVTFNRSPRIFTDTHQVHVHSDVFNNLDIDGPDVNGVDDSHFFYKYSSSFRQPRK